jgi:hypothetical protein
MGKALSLLFHSRLVAAWETERIFLKIDWIVLSSQHACHLSWGEQVVHTAMHTLLNP